MEQIFLAYNPFKESDTTIKIINKNTKAMVCSPDGNASLYDIVAVVLQGGTISIYNLLILRTTNVNLMKENRPKQKRQEVNDSS